MHDDDDDDTEVVVVIKAESSWCRVTIYLQRRTVTTYHHYLNHNQTHPPLNPHLSSLQLTRTLSSSSAKMSNLNQAKNIWRKANAVCFDVDSTVIQEEAIDELAKYCGKGDEVQQL